MQLIAPVSAPKLVLKDINGKSIFVGEGRRLLLVFFRDAACPFCNMHIYRLTQQYDNLHAKGLEVVTVFSSTPEQVKRFILARPRPFKVAADPTSEAYDIYGVEKSFWRKLWAVITRFPTLIRGLHKLGWAGSLKGLAGVNTTNMMPADFLINEKGFVVEAYYGKDAGDHISFERIESFLERNRKRTSKEQMAEKSASFTPGAAQTDA